MRREISFYVKWGCLYQARKNKMTKDEARHGKALKGLLDRYFK